LSQFRKRTVCAAAFAASLMMSSGPARAEDKLLTEAVNFTGTIAFLTTKVPGFILVAVRNGETAFAGFGKVTDIGDKAPDAELLTQSRPNADDAKISRACSNSR
jgi:serine-type D-Ala-D-Ala carboxypeptidase/endopeptidase